MLVYTDRVAETSATVGTGNIALAGALDATYRAFAAVMSNGDTTDICIFGVDDFETCRATLSSGALVRGTVYASTNGGAHVDFGAGVKTVIMCLPGALAVPLASGGDLNAIEALSGTGIAVRIAADTWVVRSLTAPAAGITITNPAGIAGNPTFTLANDLAALEAQTGTGIARRTGADTWSVGVSVSYGEIQNVTASRLLGNPTGGVAAPSEISLGATLAFSSGALQTSAGTGDVTWSANSYATTITNGAVTNAKLASAANQTIKSNISGGAAAPADNTLTAILDNAFGSTQGSIIHRGASVWAALGPGTAGQVLQTQGAGANPIWANAAGGGGPRKITEFKTSGTWTRAAGSTVAIVVGVGGGGGGGAGDSTGNARPNGTDGGDTTFGALATFGKGLHGNGSNGAANGANGAAASGAGLDMFFSRGGFAGGGYTPAWLGMSEVSPGGPSGFGYGGSGGPGGPNDAAVSFTGGGGSPGCAGMKRVDISATASATVTIGAAGTGGSNGVLSGLAGGPGYLYVIEY